MYNAKQIACWLLMHNKADCMIDEEVDAITNLKLQKLLYYMQGVFLALKEKPLFNDDIIAWKHGPVIPGIYYNFSEFGANPIEFKPTEDELECIRTIEKDEIVHPVLLEVYEHYNGYTAWCLRNMTHDEKPWKETELSQVIEKNLIKDYFKAEVVEI